MKLSNIFRNNQNTALVSEAVETELDERALANINGGCGDDYERDDCHYERDDCHYERDDCHYEEHYRRHHHRRCE